MGWWLSLAPATLEFWVRFPNERNQGKQGANLCCSTGFLTGPSDSEDGPWRGTLCGRGLLAWTRGRPTATGVGSLSHPYHITRSYCSLARPPHTHSLVLVTAISRMRAGPMVRATFWSSKLSTPRNHRHWFCIIAILRSRSFTQAGPWIIATQPARNALPRRDLGF
jgi:hypothetical protein